MFTFYHGEKYIYDAQLFIYLPFFSFRAFFFFFLICFHDAVADESDIHCAFVLCSFFIFLPRCIIIFRLLCFFFTFFTLWCLVSIALGNTILFPMRNEFISIISRHYNDDCAMAFSRKKNKTQKIKSSHSHRWIACWLAIYICLKLKRDLPQGIQQYKVRFTPTQCIIA